MALDAEFVVINYDGIEVVHQELLRGGFDLIVCDEASALKNPQTKRWKLMNQLLRQETWLWLLTGTPTPNAPTDAYGMAKLVNNAFGKSFRQFQDETMTKVSGPDKLETMWRKQLPAQVGAFKAPA